MCSWGDVGDGVGEVEGGRTNWGKWTAMQTI